jgi:hypothetical protein
MRVDSRWAKAFNCPVYISAEDQEWLMRKDNEVQNCWTGKGKPILPQITVVKVGGHFPGTTALRMFSNNKVLQSSTGIVQEIISRPLF